jgi:hypothetical protein
MLGATACLLYREMAETWLWGFMCAVRDGKLEMRLLHSAQAVKARRGSRGVAPLK